MGNLIYSAIASLDGYVADEYGNFDWAEPDEEVHSFINDLERRIGHVVPSPDIEGPSALAAYPPVR
jgi:hypothetical protein